MKKKIIKEGEEGEECIENKHITMGLSTVITVGIFIICLTWSASLLWNNDRSHEEKQDLRTEKIAKRDSTYFKKLNANVSLLLKRTENDSVDLKIIKNDNKIFKSLMSTIIRNQKGNADTIINQILRLYSHNYSKEEKKKWIAQLRQQNLLKEE
jgi:hypothetical protein